MTGEATSQALRPERSGSGPSTSFRFDYALRLGVALIVGATLSVLTVYALLASDLGSYQHSFLVVSSVRRLTLGAGIASGLVQLVVAGLLVSAIALVASHKLAGPTIRLERVLEGMAEGHLPGDVRFRRGDQTGQLATSFNRLRRVLDERHARLQSDLEGVRAAYAQIEQSLSGPGGGGSARAPVDELCTRVEGLAEAIERFATEIGQAPDVEETGCSAGTPGGTTREP